MTPRASASQLVSQRLEQLDREVKALRQAEESAALGAVELVDNLQTARIHALIDMVQLLAAELDRIESGNAGSG